MPLGRGQPVPQLQASRRTRPRRLRGAGCGSSAKYPSQAFQPQLRAGRLRAPHVPDRLDDVGPASRGLYGPTSSAWTMLVRKAHVKPGETVLVHAAGSGVGSAGIQIAKLLGATVITTASTQEKLNRGKELGADYLINYAQTDFLQEVKKITQRRMVDVVFEHVGTDTFEKSVACLPYGGRLVTCGATTGYEAKLDLRVLFYKQISLLGSTMGSKGDLFRILELVQQGRLRPVLDRVLPLQKAAEAQRQLESRAHFGNVVLVPS